MNTSGKQQRTGSTQRFTEVIDIIEDVVLFEGNFASLVLEIQATNFELFSEEEQRSKIVAYAGLLNSLSFSIQILIRSKRVDASAYIKHLQSKAIDTSNQKLAQQILQYKSFVESLVKTNTILDKKFYIVLSYSPLEKGAGGLIRQDSVFQQAKVTLHTKVDSILSELNRLSLRATIVQKEGLVRLFHDIYNQGLNEEHIIEDGVTKPVVQAK